MVIGIGRFGAAVARTLHDLGHDVIAVDIDEGEIQQVMDDVTHAAVLDATDEVALAQIGVDEVDTVIVAIGDNLEASILATVNAKAAGAKYVISKANDATAARVLASVGADEIVRPEHDMGRRLAQQLASPNEIGTLDVGPDHAIVELEVRDRLRGSLAKIALTERFHVEVLAVHHDREVVVHPEPEDEVEPGDRIVVIGRTEDLAALRRHLGQ